MGEKIIDVWMQHPTARFLSEPFFDSLKKWTRQEFTDTIPLEATVRAMDEAGVAVGMMAAWHGPQGALISNDQVAEWIAQFPDRFIGIAAVDLARPLIALRELRRCVRDLGFRGLRIVPWLWGLPPDDRRYYPLYAECIELDIPFCLQVGHTGPLLASEPGRPIPYLENVAIDFPELRIVAGHIGAPWTAEMISLATKFENVYIDTSAYKVSRFPPEFRSYLQSHGRAKIMFGSNYPMLTPSACLSDLDSLALEEATRADYLGQTASRVFRLD